MVKRFALVYWIESKRTEILKCQIIPERYRRENAIVKLKYHNVSTKTVAMRLAKIIKMEERKTSLTDVMVDINTGIITEKISKKISQTNESERVIKKNIKKKIVKKNKKTKHIDHTSNTNTSDSELSSEESANESEDSSDEDENNSRAIKHLLSWATSENLKFVRELLSVMEKCHKKQIKTKEKKKKKEKKKINKTVPVVPSHEDLVNMQLSLKSFLSPMTITAIFHRHPDTSNWRKLSTDILQEIYGKRLAHMSAKGSRGAQGIDPDLFRVLYDIVNARLGHILLSTEFVKHINKVCSNRKQALEKRRKNNSNVDWSNVEVKMELPGTLSEIESFDQPLSPQSSISTYQEYMSENREQSSKPIKTCVTSVTDSFNNISSCSMANQSNLYQDYMPDSSSNQVSDHYIDEYIT